MPTFVRIHSALRVTPAMAAGVTDRLWEVADIAALIDAREGRPKKRGPYSSTTQRVSASGVKEVSTSRAVPDFQIRHGPAAFQAMGLGVLRRG